MFVLNIADDFFEHVFQRDEAVDHALFVTHQGHHFGGSGRNLLQRLMRQRRMAEVVLGEQKTAQVMMAAIVINAWNRIGVGTQMQPAL